MFIQQCSSRFHKTRFYFPRGSEVRLKCCGGNKSGNHNSVWNPILTSLNIERLFVQSINRRSIICRFVSLACRSCHTHVIAIVIFPYQWLVPRHWVAGSPMKVTSVGLIAMGSVLNSAPQKSGLRPTGSTTTLLRIRGTIQIML